MINDISVIIQGGAVGLALVLIGVLGFIIKWFCKFINTTLSHNSQLIAANTKAVNANLRATKELTTYFKAINGKLISKNEGT